jgi:UDP-N-acetylglucosamine 2-epimerase
MSGGPRCSPSIPALSDRRKQILLIAGARPNFMKVASLSKAFSNYPEKFRARIIHTGQHYDPDMSDIFFEELGLGRPDRFLGVDRGVTRNKRRKLCSHSRRFASRKSQI